MASATANLTSSDEIRVSLAKDSLRHFIEQAWPLVEPGTPLVWGWHLDVVCEHFEAVSAGEIRKLCLNVPPRTMKSLTTSVFWPAWEWLKHAELRYLSASHSGPLAVRDATRTRRLMQTEGLGLVDDDLRVINHGQPPTAMQKIGYRGFLEALDNLWEFAGDANLKSRYENDQAGYRIATSIGGSATGEGGDRVLIDDPHKLEEWDSDARRQDAIDFVTQIVPSRLNSAEAATVMIMQRVHEEDATAAVLEEGDWIHVCLPMEYEPKHPFAWPDDPREEPGELLWPERFDAERVKAIKRSLGALKYAGNYQQRPSPAEGDVFKRADWGYWAGPGSGYKELPHEWQLLVFSWDATFGETDDPGASYVVGQLWAQDGPDVYLLAQIRDRMSFSEMKAALPALATYAPGGGAVLVEEKAAGKPLIEELRKVLPALLPINPKKSKLARAVATQPYQEAGNVYLPAGAIPAPPGYEPTATAEFVDRFATFPAAAHDDEIDAYSQALEHIHHTGGEVASVSTVPTGEEPKVQRFGLEHRGKKYVDKTD